MELQHLIFFLLPVLAWTYETTVYPTTPENLEANEIPDVQPYLSLRNEPESPLEGDVANLVCTLDHTSTQRKFRWVRYTEAGTSEQIVPNSSNFSRFSIQSKRNETKYEEILTIKDLQLSDARDYGCDLTDRSQDELMLYAYIWLNVTPKP